MSARSDPPTPHSPAGSPSGPFVTDSGPQLPQSLRLAHLGSRVLITAASKQTKPVGSPRGGSAPLGGSAALCLLKIRVPRLVPACFFFFPALVGPHETLSSRQHLRQDSTRMDRITNLMASSPCGQITAPTSQFHAASPSAHSRFLLLVHQMLSGALGIFHLTEKVFLFLQKQKV